MRSTVLCIPRHKELFIMFVDGLAGEDVLGESTSCVIIIILCLTLHMHAG